MRTFDWIIVGGGITGISLCEILIREEYSAKVISELNIQKNYKYWCPQRESNTRPLPYHGSALPTELYGLS